MRLPHEALLRPAAATSLLMVLVAVCTSGCQGVVWDPPSGTPTETPPVETPARVGDEFSCADPDARGPAPLRRLTIPEYIATIGDVFGVDVSIDAAARIPPDVRADGFSNTASGLVVDVAHVEAFADLALQVANAADLGLLLAEVGVDCAELSAPCERQTIEALALRIYRAPVTEEEIAALVDVYDEVVAEEGDYAEGTRYVVMAMLSSPRFLYKVERQDGDGTHRTLSGWELASRLSYLLWAAPPDAMLRDSAEADALGTDAAIEAHVVRMLDDPRARATSVRYLSDWMHLRRLDNIVRDPATFPGWDAGLAAEMRTETTAYFEHLVWEEGRPLNELWNAQVTFVSGRLAAYYGLEAAGPEVTEYDLSGVSERGGFLTQGSLLTIGGPSASMVARGKFFLENVLCGAVNDPPPGVDTTPPEPMPGYTQRDQSEERRMNATCGGCHAQMDPLAYGLERFNGAGGFALADEFGNDLREDGEVLFPGAREPVPFASVGELMDVLAGSDRVRDCATLKATQFALGRGLAASDGCSLVAVREAFTASEGTYQDLMVAIALSDGFRTIRVE